VDHNQAIVQSILLQLRIIWGALVSSVLMYIFVGERVPHRETPPHTVVLEAVALACLTTVIMIFVVRRILVAKAAAVLASQPDDAPAMARWRGGYIVTLALCEAVALFGLVLRLAGFTLGQAGMFYLASGVLMIFFVPRRPEQLAA
jgi:F0F1-type ATP synthase membrane subunit c/vacuolar-type H+-ATPase subunit K